MARQPAQQPVPELIRQYSLALLLLRERRRGITCEDIMFELKEHYYPESEQQILEVGEDKAAIAKIKVNRRKMFQRDCDDLEELGIRITRKKGFHEGFFYSINPDDFSAPDEKFEILRELQLKLALESIKDLGGPLFAEDLDSVRVKLGLKTIAKKKKAARSLEPVYIETPAGESSRIVDELFDRMRDKAPISIYYQGAKDKGFNMRRVQPVGMIYRWGDWHLVAYDLDKQGYRLFRAENLKQNQKDISKLKGAPVLDLPDADKAMSEYLEAKPWDMGMGPEVEVRVRLSRDIAGRVSLALGDAVKFKPPKGGGVEARIKARNLDNLCGWLMRFGQELEVLGPPGARKVMREKASLILKAQRGKRGGQGG